MPEWTPKEVRDVLQTGDERRKNQLGAYLLHAAEAGHVYFHYMRPWHRFSPKFSKGDDAGDTMVVLFKNEARVLNRYGDHPGFVYAEDSLRKYVIGITWNVLQKRYQDRTPQWEELEQDLASVDGDPTTSRAHAHHDRLADLARAVGSLSPRDQDLFAMLYVRQLEPEEICKSRDISRNTLDAQKSRLLKRLLRFLAGDFDDKGDGG